MTSAIYSIRNIVNGKIYVGSAVDYEARWAAHRSRLNSGDHHSAHLQRSWNKHGADAFVFEVLEIVKKSRRILVSREQHWIDTLGAFGLFGFNMVPNATNGHGIIRSQEYRAKQSAIRTGMKLKPHTEETKEKIRRAHLGRPKGPMSDAHKDAIAAANMGKVMSPESRAKIALAHKGKPKGPMPQWHKDKIAAANLGRKWSPERVAREAGVKHGPYGPRGPMPQWWRDNIAAGHRERAKRLGET